MTILHVTPTDAAKTTEALKGFIEAKELDYHTLVCQGYDGAAVFSGCRNNVVQIRMNTSSAHAIYLHCACHRLQLASIQAADSNPGIKSIFGMMSNVWKLFYYSLKKVMEAQSVLGLPELKVVKPSDTRWFSYKRCMGAIKKELPALIITTLRDIG